MSGDGLEAVIARPANVGRGSRCGWVAVLSAAAGPSRSPAGVWCPCSHCLVCARLSLHLWLRLISCLAKQHSAPLLCLLPSSLNLLQSLLKAVGGPGSRPGFPETLGRDSGSRRAVPAVLLVPCTGPELACAGDGRSAWGNGPTPISGGCTAQRLPVPALKLREHNQLQKTARLSQEEQIWLAEESKCGYM